MDKTRFVETVAGFLSRKSGVAPAEILATPNLLTSGIVNSLLVTELILLVEDLTGTTVDIDDFSLAQFSTVEGIYASYGTREGC